MDNHEVKNLKQMLFKGQCVNSPNINNKTLKKEFFFNDKNLNLKFSKIEVRIILSNSL